MSTYLISTMTIHDPETYRKYTAGTPPTVKRHGGKFLTRGEEVITSRQMESRLRMALEKKSGAVKSLEAFLNLAGEVAEPAGDREEILVVVSRDNTEELVAWLRGRATLLCREP